MEFTVQDTLSVYRKIIADDNTDKKQAIFRDELLNPYEGMFNAFGGSLNPKPGQMDGMQFIGSWSMILPGQLDEKALKRVETMERFGVLKLMAETLADTCQAFKEYESRIPLKHIQAGFFLLDPAKMDPADHGYSGFGAIPGYVMVTYGEPDAYNLSKLQPTLAHETHHTIYGAAVPRNMMTITVGEYMIMEGLAESFATSLYGKDRVGYFVEEFDMARLPEVKKGMKKALDLKGFDVVRSYIFGDRKATKFGGKAVGMPDHAGYVVGYFIVQDYMKKTGRDIVETTFTPVEEIIGESGFFD